MNILHISHRHHIAGGSDAVFFATTDLLRSAGHRVVPFCLTDPDNQPSDYQSWFVRGATTGNPTIRDAARYFWNHEAQRKLESLICAHGPFDVAHLHIYHGKHTPAILATLRRHCVPTVHTLHEYKLACPVYTMQRNDKPCDTCLNGVGVNPIRYRCKSNKTIASAVMLAEFHMSRALGDRRLINRFICVSEFQKQVMLRAGISPEKLAVLHNFVQVPDTVSPPGQYFLYFGRIEKLKGLNTLVDAALQTGCELVIAGDGNWSKTLQQKISGHPSIRWLGFQNSEQIKVLLANARAVVVPSQWYENCPMSVLEAKSQGRAIIASDIGGIPELVHDDIDGILCSPGDTGQFAQAMLAMTPERAMTFGQNAHADVQKRFSPGTHLARLIARYKSAAACLENKTVRPVPHQPA